MNANAPIMVTIIPRIGNPDGEGGAVVVVIVGLVVEERSIVVEGGRVLVTWSVSTSAQGTTVILVLRLSRTDENYSTEVAPSLENCKKVSVHAYKQLGMLHVYTGKCLQQ
jgi:hypothetical protein